MTRILFVGQKPETVDYSDPALQPGFSADKITPASRLPSRRSSSAAGRAIPA
jgi:hypothetical protein